MGQGVLWLHRLVIVCACFWGQPVVRGCVVFPRSSWGRAGWGGQRGCVCTFEAFVFVHFIQLGPEAQGLLRLLPEGVGWR